MEQEQQPTTQTTEQEPVEEQAAQQAETEETALETRIDELNEKIAELNDKNLRMMAEFDNYRKRTLKEKADLIANAGERIFTEMLPIVDDFERAVSAMQTTDDIEAVREGVNLIYSKFVGFLQKNGVKAIDTDQADFDTNFHEALTTIPAPSEELKGKVVDCTTKGYMLGDKVIRYAKVVVGQ